MSEVPRVRFRFRVRVMVRVRVRVRVRFSRVDPRTTDYDRHNSPQTPPWGPAANPR